MIRTLTRRTALGLIGFLTLSANVAHASPATDFVTSFGAQLANVLNSSEAWTVKKKEILPLVQKNVDIAGIGRYCLGRYWHRATPEQQRKYLSLFDQVLVNAVTSRIGSYQNVGFRVTGGVPIADGERVSAEIYRPKQPSVTLQIVVGGSPLKVVDMYGEGVSMRLTQRDDYSSYLSRHGGNIDDLISALERQIANHS